MTVLASLVAALREAAVFNKHELAAPRVILWPDEERLWTACIEPLRERLPALWSLGDYAPDKGTGPAAWLRYQLDTYAGTEMPVVYLPGIDRSAFRSADQCPKEATHLFALQFLGQFWTQRNGKNWTPSAFLSSKDGGLGLDVAGDQETRRAIHECLRPLLAVEISALQVGKLEAGDFRAIVTKDPARTLLRWMGAPVPTKAALAAEWSSFRAVCLKRYLFDPDKDGTLTAAERLVDGKADWPMVWQRYKEAPRSYPGVKELLDKVSPASLFEQASELKPRSNKKAEERLEADLLALSSATQKDASLKVKALFDEHGKRAEWVWASLGDAPLAKALLELRVVAEAIHDFGSPSTWPSITDAYASIGWKADYAALRALAEARASISATKAVTAAVRAIYLPWLERFAEVIQAMASKYPTPGPSYCRALAVEQGTIHLFADGLRLDLARALEERLAAANHSLVFRCDWAALPTVTATAKHAWQPLAAKLGGPLEGAAFQAKEQQNGKDLTQPRFKQLLEELGISFVEPSEAGSPAGCGWTEYGTIDAKGHEEGSKLAWRIEEELAGLQNRIEELLKAGWTKVNVVTDHGWLMVPGGLPKVELLSHLTMSRWSRCAIPEPGAKHGYAVTSWFWDATAGVVLAAGAACFVNGKEYAHGGLTMQEALIPTLTVTASKALAVVALKELKWSGLRFNVVFEGAAGLIVDLRGKAADGTSTFAASTVIAAPDGQKTSLLVPDDDRLGTAAFLVVLDASGACIFKHSVVIGEN